jgi:hypothetical protein
MPFALRATMEQFMKRYLLASDFDRTLSFNDSGQVLSEMLGIDGFAEKAAGLADIHLVQQGGELAHLLLHDRFPFYVVSAAPQEVIRSALDGRLRRPWPESTLPRQRPSDDDRDVVAPAALERLPQ